MEIVVLLIISSFKQKRTILTSVKEKVLFIQSETMIKDQFFSIAVLARVVLFCFAASGAAQHVIRIHSTRSGSSGDGNVKIIYDDDTTDDVQELYITQKLDHFNPNDVATFQQRYFVSYRYHKDPTGPIISLLCVGGEGPALTKAVLIDSVHCSGDMLEFAERISNQGRNVHLYALEHRYYGMSYPTFTDKYGNGTSSPLTVENLRYLSSRQALEDLAHFVQSINQETKTDGMVLNTWIAFGGSYPGLMALYSRYKYPHLIFGAVSSSAPLELQVDYSGYKTQQGWGLKYKKVGGSAECYRIVKEGHVQAVALLQQTNQTIPNSTIDGRVELAKKFNICHPDIALTKRRNQELLLGDGLIDIPSQGNDPSCTENDICNIARLCKYMVQEVKVTKTEVNNSAPLSNNVELDVLAKVSQKQKSQVKINRRNYWYQSSKVQPQTIRKFQELNQADDCVDTDYDGMIELYSSDEISSFGFRSWLYQTCTEFGFYQTCLDDCPFASYWHQVDMDLEICYRVFNITNVYDNVQNSLDHYGGKAFVNTDATNILSINGNVDPWSVLGLKENDSTSYRLPTKIVDGASHHFWTHAVKDTDALEVIQIREFLYSCLQSWLGINPLVLSDSDKVTSSR